MTRCFYATWGKFPKAGEESSLSGTDWSTLSWLTLKTPFAFLNDICPPAAFWGCCFFCCCCWDLCPHWLHRPTIACFHCFNLKSGWLIRAAANWMGQPPTATFSFPPLLFQILSCSWVKSKNNAFCFPRRTKWALSSVCRSCVSGDISLVFEVQFTKKGFLSHLQHLSSYV